MKPDSSPLILVLPKPSLYRQLFSEQSDAALRSLGRVVFHEEEKELTSQDLAERIGAIDIVVTGWRAAKFTTEVLEAARNLKLIAHSAGSVKFMLDDDCLERGIEVTNVAAAMAQAVAETTLMFIMLLLRPMHQLDHRLKQGHDWREVKIAGSALSEIAGQRIGIIGAGNTGRAVIRLLRAVGAQLVVFDPYLSDAAAAELAVERIPSLDDLLGSCRI